MKKIMDKPTEAEAFESNLRQMLGSCLRSQSQSYRVRRERMWSSYHTLRTSSRYVTQWRTYLESCDVPDFSSMFCQYVGHYVFQQMIKLQYPAKSTADAAAVTPAVLTYEEANGLRYAAGFVPRAIKKELAKSAHPLKGDIRLCILDLLDDGDEETNSTKDWVELVNRGVLTRINDMTFEVFRAMELELHKHLHADKAPRLDKHVHQAIIDSEDVQFFWSILSADWEEASASALLQMIVNHWVKIRGFSYASAWVEEYKRTQKKTTQKSKGVRKQLLPKPKTTPKDSSQETLDS